MQIFLVRHGIAGPASSGVPDRERILTSEGERQSHLVARMAAKAVSVGAVLSSPYQRALQTSAIFREELKTNVEIVQSASLTPECSPEEAWADIRAHLSLGALLVVGHEPLFSALTGYLLGHPDLAIEFSPGTIICLDVNPLPRPHGVLRWMLTAKLAAA